MKLNKCYLCGEDNSQIIHKGTRGGYTHINVLKCNNCGLVRLSESVDDIDNFYVESGMRNNVIDTPEHHRKATLDDSERRYQFTQNIIAGKTVLDFGCGAGGYLVLAKNVAESVQGIELENAMREGLNKEGIPCAASLDDVKKYDVITMFHVLEHLDEPLKYLAQIKQHLNVNGKLLIEVPNADDALLSLYKSDLFADFTYWHCHVYLYTNETIKRLAKKAGFKVDFIQQVQRYTLSNHLYWLVKGKPGGHKEFAFLNDVTLDKQYGDLLAKTGIADTIMAQFSI